MDHPAAHSMDSTWFAVDADGYVAVFCTLEDGPLPAGASRGYGDIALTDVSALECARAFAAGERDDGRAIHDDVPWPPSLVLVFDGGHPDAARWLDAPGFRRLCDDPPSRVVASYPGLDADAVRALRASPALRASFWLHDGGGDGALEAMGVYVYEFAYEGDGVYARAGVGPERPRTVTTMTGVPVFPLPRSRFARDARVRVDDQLPCVTWGER